MDVVGIGGPSYAGVLSGLKPCFVAMDYDDGTFAVHCCKGVPDLSVEVGILDVIKTQVDAFKAHGKVILNECVQRSKGWFSNEHSNAQASFGGVGCGVGGVGEWEWRWNS